MNIIICGVDIFLPGKMGPYDRYKWSYNNFKWPNKWVAVVTTPICGGVFD